MHSFWTSGTKKQKDKPGGDVHSVAPSPNTLAYVGGAHRIYNATDQAAIKPVAGKIMRKNPGIRVERLLDLDELDGESSNNRFATACEDESTLIREIDQLIEEYGCNHITEEHKQVRQS
eukprot:SAG31_NODE_9377_length_1288_cov_1.055509_1_plen_118_part_10